MESVYYVSMRVGSPIKKPSLFLSIPLVHYFVIGAVGWDYTSMDLWPLTGPLPIPQMIM
jgi:hypothetical protein